MFEEVVTFLLLREFLGFVFGIVVADSHLHVCFVYRVFQLGVAQKMIGGRLGVGVSQCFEESALCPALII